MDVAQIGKQGLTGWRKKVGEPVAAKLADRTSLSPESARAVVGGAFVAISAFYVAKTLAGAARAGRG